MCGPSSAHVFCRMLKHCMRPFDRLPHRSIIRHYSSEFSIVKSSFHSAGVYSISEDLVGDI